MSWVGVAQPILVRVVVAVSARTTFQQLFRGIKRGKVCGTMSLVDKEGSWADEANVVQHLKLHADSYSRSS